MNAPIPIHIDVSKLELELIREALIVKHRHFMAKLAACEEESMSGWVDISSINEEDFEEEFKAVVANKKPLKKAPYGFKKDGTPKAKPGRKV
jgi:hypothetical protein